MAPEHPILLSWDILNQNVLALGRPGKGKTSRVLLPISVACIAHGGISLDFLDFKGDAAVMNSLRLWCEQFAVPFKVVSSQAGKASHVCNLLYDVEEMGLSPDERAFAIGYAMGTMHPTRVYGAGFFSDDSALNKMLYVRPQVYGDAPSWRNLTNKLMDPRGLFPEPDKGTLRQLQSICMQLSFTPQLNALPARLIGNDITKGHPVSDEAWANRVSVLGRVYDPPSVVYWDFSTLANPGPSVITGQLLTGLFNVAISKRRETPKNLRHLFIVDEAQHWLTSSTVKDMEMNRSKKVGTVVAHQELSQLVFGTTDLRQRVLSVCNTQMFLSASAREEVENLQFFGGEDDEIDVSFGESFDANDSRSGSSMNYSRRIRDRFSRDEALDIASREELGFIRLSVDRWPYIGNGAMKAAYFDYAMGPDEFGEISDMPWIPPSPAAPAYEGTDWLHQVVDPTFRPKAKRIFDS